MCIYVKINRICVRTAFQNTMHMDVHILAGVISVGVILVGVISYSIYWQTVPGMTRHASLDSTLCVCVFVVP